MRSDGGSGAKYEEIGPVAKKSSIKQHTSQLPKLSLMPIVLNDGRSGYTDKGLKNQVQEQVTGPGDPHFSFIPSHFNSVFHTKLDKTITGKMNSCFYSTVGGY